MTNGTISAVDSKRKEKQSESERKDQLETYYYSSSVSKKSSNIIYRSQICQIQCSLDHCHLHYESRWSD